MIRDLVMSLTVLGLLPVAFRRPFIGLLLFSWLAYMRPQDLTWGFARQQRWSMLVAAVTVCGFIVAPKVRWLVRDVRNYAMILLGVWVGLGVLLSYRPTPFQNSSYFEFAKILGVSVFTTAVVTKREHLRILMWVIALSFGFYGLKIGLMGILSGFSLYVKQGPGGMIADNNNFALALLMGVPLLLQMAASERREVLRRWTFVLVPLTSLAVLLTRSRGAFLALIATFMALVWRSRNRGLGLLIAFGGILLALFLSPEEYLERLRSIGSYEEDGSAMGRIWAWKTSMQMVSAHPFFGVGLDTFLVNYRYYCVGPAFPRVAHSAYFQMWAECGTPALLLYLFLIAATFFSLWRVRARARELFRASWIINYATMFEASMVAFLVGSAFLNRATFDLFYHFVAIVIVFERIAMEEMEQGVPVMAAGSGGTLVAVDEPSFRAPRPARGFRDTPLPGGVA